MVEVIQVFRAVAASLVVFFHAQGLAGKLSERTAQDNAWLNQFFHLSGFGAIGVDFFFVISGFVMAYTTWNLFQNRGASFTFLKKRMIRVVPIYWFYTSLMILLLLIAPQLFSTLKLDPGMALLSYFFIPSNTTPEHILEVAWTLTYEMYFYLWFSVCLLFPRRHLIKITGSVFLLSVLIGKVFNFEFPLFHYLTNSLLLEFWIGVIIGSLYRRQFKTSKLIAASLILLGMCAMALWIVNGTGFSGGDRFLDWGIPASLIIAGTLFFPDSEKIQYPSWLKKLGDSSYTLYLSHPFVLPFFGKLWTWKATESVSLDLLILISFALAVGIGHVLYLMIEKPITKKLSGSASR